MKTQYYTATSIDGYIADEQITGFRQSTALFVICQHAWISLFAAVMLGITVFLEQEATFMIPDVQSCWALLGLGVTGQVLGWVLISKGLPKLDAAIGGLAILLEPALSFMWDILFFNRPTSLLDYAGAAIMLIAIYLGAVSNRKKG